MQQPVDLVSVMPLSFSLGAVAGRVRPSAVVPDDTGFHGPGGALIPPPG